MRQGTGYKTRPDDLCPASISRFFQQVRDCKIEWNNLCPIFWARNCTSDSIIFLWWWRLLIKLLFQSQYLSLTLDFQFFLSISLMKTWSFMMKSKTRIFLNIYDWMFENIFTHFVGLLLWIHLEIQNDIFADFGRVFFSDISDWLLKEIILTILSGKSCVYSIQYKNGCLAASDLFHIFT